MIGPDSFPGVFYGHFDIRGGGVGITFGEGQATKRAEEPDGPPILRTKDGQMAVVISHKAGGPVDARLWDSLGRSVDVEVPPGQTLKQGSFTLRHAGLPAG